MLERHLIILVHGFKGNQFDMRLIQIVIRNRYPQTLFLLSSANEDYTEGNIEVMGLNLAQEIRANLDEKESLITK